MLCKIYDLNNIPLVSGSSYIKWHLVHSIHAEHRGRTSKCSITNHRVDYSFSKHVPSIRISVDKNNCLTDCPLELEVVQEFATTDKITLGFVRLNLSEYIEESETFAKEITFPQRKRSGSNALSSRGSLEATQEQEVEDGIIRRHLMQESKINSTLKVGILMVQTDGDRHFIAPPLKTAPVFGGIAGLMAPDQVEDDVSHMSTGQSFSSFHSPLQVKVPDGSQALPNLAKPRDNSEIQDLYRRTLAASWYSQTSELPADECIEDIFSGGNGWRTKVDSSATASDEEEMHSRTLRPGDFRRMTQHQQQRTHHATHRRAHSGASDKSITTVTGRAGTYYGSERSQRSNSRDGSGGSRDGDRVRDRSGSLVSMVPTMHSDNSRDEAYKRIKEVREADARDDLVAWSLPNHGLAT